MPAELAAAPISDRALRLWIVLEQHQGPNPYSWPSRQHLADHLSCSVDTIDRVMIELEKSGWVEIKRSPGRRPNRYTALIHNSRTGAAVTELNSRTGAVDGDATAAPVRAQQPHGCGTEADVKKQPGRHRLRNETTDRARDTCELGAPVALDGSCCTDHDQLKLWPAAIGR